jgi:hypothetical protein
MRETRFCQRLRLIRFTEDALTLERWTPGATTERQSQIARLTRCQVARAEGTSARNWLRNALPPKPPQRTGSAIQTKPALSTTRDVNAGFYLISKVSRSKAGCGNRVKITQTSN